MDHTSAGSHAGLHARLFGQVRIAIGDRSIANDVWPRKSSRLLLLMLLVAPGYRLHRDAIMESLWPAANADSAAKSLYVAVHTLRRILEPDLQSGPMSRYVDVSGDIVRLLPEAVSWVDVAAFEAELSAVEGDRRVHLASALGLYVGDLLGDEPYLDWPAVRREHLRAMWREAVLEFANLEFQAGRSMHAVPAIERVLQSDPTDEVACRAMMTAFAAAGRREDALRQFDRITAVLDEEFGIEPSHETISLAAEIRDAPVTHAAGPRVATMMRNLPAPPNPLVGRGRDLEELVDLVCQPDVRMVTITGAGGVGKTRLAIEIGWVAVEEFTDGVCFVSLGPVRDPGLVLPNVSRALGLDDSSDRSSLEQLQERLRDSHLLLVLDNLEHLLDAALDIAALLAACSNLTLLVTSREPVRLRSEHHFPLMPLPVPDPERLLTVGSVTRYAAVELFIQRARAVRRDFTVTESNAGSIGSLCARLDGLPLAIELAAARVSDREPQELLDGLTDRFTLLADGYRDLPPRQRTMRAAIAWSYDLLNEEERILFRRVAVFAGGFGIEAAQHVSGAVDTLVLERLATTLQGLVDKALVRLDTTVAQQRYEMFETIREFAFEALGGGPERAVTEQAHAEWFLALTEQAAPELTGADQALWLELLDGELANLRVAFAHLLQRLAGSDAPLQMAAALWRYWWSRGEAREGRAWLEQALLIPDASSRVRAQALYAAAELAEVLTDYPQAECWYQEALTLRQSLGDDAGSAEILNGLGLLARIRGDLDRAEDLHEQALSTLERTGDRRGMASAMNNLGAVAYFRGDTERTELLWNGAVSLVRELEDMRALSGLLGNLGALAIMRKDPHRALALHEEGLAVAHRVGDPDGITQALVNLGGALYLTDDLPGAARIYEEALERCREAGNRASEAIVLYDLGKMADTEHVLARAAERYAEALTLFWKTENLPGVAACLERMGSLATGRGDAVQAVQMFGAASAIRDATGASRDTVDHGDYERDLELLRTQVTDATFASLWADGLQLVPADAVAMALASADALRHSPPR